MVGDGAEHREEAGGVGGAAAFGEGTDGPEGSMGVLPTVLAHTGDIAFDVARIVRRLVEGRGEEADEFVLLVYEPFQDIGGAYATYRLIPANVDGDADDDPLTALLVSGPPSGTLALQADGSFAIDTLAGTVTGALAYDGAQAALRAEGLRGRTDQAVLVFRKPAR